MCSKQNTKSGLMVSSAVYGLGGIALVIMGQLVSTDQEIPIAYGRAVNNAGFVLAVTGGILLALAVVGLYGGTQHNKMCLLVHCGVSGANLAVQIIAASTILALISSPFDTELEQHCLTNTPPPGTEYSDADCEAYLGSDTFATMYEMWAAMENRSTVDETYKQTLETLEADGGCCGFGVPGRCEAGRRVPETVPAKCGEEEGWYPTSSYCAHTVRGVVKGCRFDQPVGDCSAALVSPASIGCAAAAESWVFGKAAPVAYVAVIFWVVHVLAICTGVCLCLKRKDTDVLPHVDLSASKRERLYYAVRLGGVA